MEGGKYTLFSPVPVVASPSPSSSPLPARPPRLLRLLVSAPPASLLLDGSFWHSAVIDAGI